MEISTTKTKGEEPFQRKESARNKIFIYSVLHHMRNEHILDKIKAMQVTEYANNNYRQDWLQYVKRMLRARIPTQIFRYVLTGRRLPGRKKRRWLETVTGH
jgi:hypothetical protein